MWRNPGISRIIAAAMVATSLLLMLGVVPAAGTMPSGPVTIVTDISFAEFPFRGTFKVTEGSTLLGCSKGTFVDTPHAFGEIEKMFTCKRGGKGDFTFLFLPTLAPGPGDANGHWQVLEGTGDFSNLRGEGDFSVVFFPETMSGVETLTGSIHFDP